MSAFDPLRTFQSSGINDAVNAPHMNAEMLRGVMKGITIG